MAAFNFPSSPNVNDTHTENGVTYKWDGTVWNSSNKKFEDVVIASDVTVNGSITTTSGNLAFGSAPHYLSGNANYLQITNSTTQKVGTNGVLVGHDSGSTTLANNCTIIGVLAGDAINSTAATDNTLIGQTAGSAITSGSGNTAVGFSSGSSITTGSNNVYVGSGTSGSTTGSNNTCVGAYASSGSFNTTNDCTYFGAYSGNTSSLSGSNNSLIGYDAEPSTSSVSNEFTLGNASIATLRCNVQTISSLSDARDKKNIKTIGLGTDFIDSVRPVEFDWNRRDGSKVDVHDCGFIAQELQEAQDKFDANWVNSVMDSNPEKLEARYGRLIPIMVKAIQELSERVEELKNGRA